MTEQTPEKPRYSVEYSMTKEGLQRILIDRKEGRLYRLTEGRNDEIVSDVAVDEGQNIIRATIRGETISVPLKKRSTNIASKALERAQKLQERMQELGNPDSPVNREIVREFLSRSGDKENTVNPSESSE